MVVAAVVSLYLQLSGPRWNSDDPQEFAYLMLVTVAVTTLAWIVVTLLTPPEPREKLVEFYRRVRPAGPGWTSVVEMAGHVERPSESLGVQFVNWMLGCVLVYAAVFGIGNLVFQQWLAGGAWLVAAAIAGGVISHNLSRADWSEATDSASG